VLLAGKLPDKCFYNQSVNSPDVIIAGGGIIGVSIALELREHGVQVMVLDRGEPGQEASSAAAGMLAAFDPETPSALCSLARESARMFPDYVRMLESLSGMQVDLRSQGTIALFDGSSMPATPEVRTYHKLAADELRRIEPAVAIQDYSAFLVEESSVDPVLLMRAALEVASAMGIEVRGGTEITAIRAHGGRIEVTTGPGHLSAAKAINCRGAWSGAPVKPRKGQMLAVRPQETALEHVVHAPGIYVVPRSSGRLVIGATVEDVGFDKTVEPETIHELHRAASSLFPGWHQPRSSPVGRVSGQAPRMIFPCWVRRKPQASSLPVVTIAMAYCWRRSLRVSWPICAWERPRASTSPPSLRFALPPRPPIVHETRFNQAKFMKK